MNTIAAKKETGLDNLFKGYNPQQLEEQTKVIVEHSNPALQEAQDVYKKWLWKWPPFRVHLPPLALTPTEINMFLQGTIEHEDHRDYRRLTGCFITHLINQSFLLGYRDFYLDVRHIPHLNFLTSEHYGIVKRPFDKQSSLKITIDGDVGHSFASHQSYSSYIINGSLGLQGFESVLSISAIIKGRAGRGNYLAFNYAFDSTFFVHEYTAGILDTTRNCTFKTDQEETFHHLKTKNMGKNNRIYLVDKDDYEVILKE